LTDATVATLKNPYTINNISQYGNKPQRSQLAGGLWSCGFSRHASISQWQEVDGPAS
jgi:hypothetical protein